jgi:hypothetical protein
MKNIIKLFRPVIIPLIVCLIASQLPLSPAYAEENITITTYYPSPSGSYLDLNVQGTLLVGTGTPASGVSSRIEFSHNTSSSRNHWNIDQAAPSGSTSNNTTNPRLRFFTEPNSNLNGFERFVLDNTSMTFRDSTGVQRLLVDDSNMIYTGVTNAGDFVLRAPTTDVNDAGDIVFQRSSASQIGRIWTSATSTSGNNELHLSVEPSNSPSVYIAHDSRWHLIGGTQTKNDLHLSNGRLFFDNLNEGVDFVNWVWATMLVKKMLLLLTTPLKK